MSNQQRRVERLQTALPPKEAFLLWMDEAHQFASLQAYSASLKGQPTSAFPLGRLPTQVEVAVRQSMKGQDRQAVFAAVQRAVRDVFFYFHLHQTLNQAVHDEQLPQILVHQVLLYKLDPLLLDLANKDTQMNSRQVLELRRAGWTELVTAFHRRYTLLAGAVDACCERFFAGVDPLFPEGRTDLEEMAREWTSMEELCVAWNGEEAGRRFPLRWPGSPDAHEVQERTRYFVDLAKAETLRMLGDFDEASGLMERYV